MTREEMNRLHLTPIEDYITEDFGEIGTPERTKFEAGADAFILGERLKEITLPDSSSYIQSTSA